MATMIMLFMLIFSQNDRVVIPHPDPSIGWCMKQWDGDGCIKGTVHNWKGELVD